MISWEWVRLPSAWIEGKGLKAFRWTKGEGSNNVAALMNLAVIAHRFDPETGIARLTYDDLGKATSLSRAKVSAGLKVLAGHQLIEREPRGQSTFALSNYDVTGGWAKFPARGLYHGDQIEAFRHLNLRLPAELDAMKLYFLFASRRNNVTNVANVTYPTIEAYTGVPRNSIRRALSLLGALGLVHIDRVPSGHGDGKLSSAYRLAHLNSRQHMGTKSQEDYLPEADIDWSPTTRL